MPLDFFRYFCQQWLEVNKVLHFKSCQMICKLEKTKINLINKMGITEPSVTWFRNASVITNLILWYTKKCPK